MDSPEVTIADVSAAFQAFSEELRTELRGLELRLSGRIAALQAKLDADTQVDPVIPESRRQD